MSYEEFRRRIDTARQILVGAVPSPAGQIDQITYALIYKFMNDIDDKSAALGGKRTYFAGDYEKYNWHALMSPSLGSHERLELYRQAIQTMANNPGLPPMFADIYRNAFLPFNSANVLTLFLKEIDKFNHGESDDIGDAYEYLLSITGAQGDVGQFRTPRHIIEFIVNAVNPRKDDSVLDPASGTAGFLIKAYEHVLKQHDGKDSDGKPNDERRLNADELGKLHHSYRGFDIDPTMVRTAKVNLYLHGFKSPDIINHDSLSSEDYWNDKYDVILANPPFMTPKGGIQPHKKFSVSANRAEVLFVDYIMSHLNPVSGRAGIIVPEGIIFQSGKAYKELRKNLIENSLYAVVSLPSGVFNPYAGVKTSILLLDKQLAKERDDILFVKIENDGYSLGAQRRPIAGNQFPEALEAIEQFRTGTELTSQLAHAVKKSEIAESGDYNLSGDRYKSVAQSSTDYPLAQLSEIITLESGSRQKGGALTSGVPSIGGEQVAEDGNIRFDKMKYISEEHFSSMRTGVLCRDDVLVVKDGATTGKTGYWYGDEKAAVNEHVYIFRADTNKILPFYLYSLVRSEFFQNILARYIKGIIGGISREILEIKIPLPPLEIQRQIVDELDGYQRIIDSATAIVKTYKPTIKINPDWKVVNLPDVAEINKSSIEPEKIFGDSTFTYIDVSSVGNNATGKIDTSNLIRAKDAPSRARRVVHIGDTLLSTVRPNLRAFAYVRALPEKSLASTGFAVLSPKSNVVPEYLYYSVIMDSYVHQLESKMGKGAYPSVNTDDLKQSTIPLPLIEEQKQIVADLETEQKLIDANKKLITLYQQKIRTKIAEVWGE